MKEIRKYTLKVTDEQFVEIPFDSKILTVQVQNELPQLWCLVDVDNIKEYRKIVIIGTGHLIKDSFKGKYISTFQLYGENAVFHVFDLK